MPRLGRRVRARLRRRRRSPRRRHASAGHRGARSAWRTGGWTSSSKAATASGSSSSPTGRSFHTGVVAPVEDEDDPAGSDAVERALRLFDRLRELTGSEVDVPEADVAAALVRPRWHGSSFRRRQARAPERRLRAQQAGSSCAISSSTRPRPPSAFGVRRSGRRRTAESISGEPNRQGYDAVVAVTTHPKLDAERLRTDFAVFDELVNGKPVAYLDSAASTQKPRQVLDAMRDFYEHSYANVHRGVYRLAERATTGYETRAPEGRVVRQRALRARGDLHAERDRGAQSRRVRLGTRQPRPGRRRRRHGSRAPLELRPVAVRRGPNRSRRSG